MNLSNGWCGPEGCAVLGTADSGRSGFAIVILTTLSLATLSVFLFKYLYMGLGSKGRGSAAASALFSLAVFTCVSGILVAKVLQSLAGPGGGPQAGR